MFRDKNLPERTVCIQSRKIFFTPEQPLHPGLPRNYGWSGRLASPKPKNYPLGVLLCTAQGPFLNPGASIHPSLVFAGGWWKVECCMLGYRKACCCTFDSYSALKQIIRPQEWLCHSWLRMMQSLQITGVKRNVLFLQRASMRKLIKGKHEKRCSFLERKGDRRSRWIVDSTLFE